MSAGQNIPRKVPCLRGVDPELRRARLMAARTYQSPVCRHAILTGQWDGGSVVRQNMKGNADG